MGVQCVQSVTACAECQDRLAGFEKVSIIQGIGDSNEGSQPKGAPWNHRDVGLFQKGVGHINVCHEFRAPCRRLAQQVFAGSKGVERPLRGAA